MDIGVGKLMAIYDCYCAAFLMSWGCRLMATSQDERGWTLFHFDKQQAASGMREWNNPQTVVVISTYLANFRYLKGLMRDVA